MTSESVREERLRSYELMYILDPTLDDESSKSLVGKIEGLISKQGASVENTEAWGRRRLAYRVRGHWEGNYVLSQLKASPETVGEMERRLRNTDGVLRFLTVRIDEQQAKTERRRVRLEEKDRARRDRRRASTSDADSKPSGAPAVPAPPRAPEGAEPEVASPSTSSASSTSSEPREEAQRENNTEETSS